MIAAADDPIATTTTTATAALADRAPPPGSWVEAMTHRGIAGFWISSPWHREMMEAWAVEPMLKGELRLERERASVLLVATATLGAALGAADDRAALFQGATREAEERALRASDRAWHEHPALWAGVGAAGMAGLVWLLVQMLDLEVCSGR